MLKCNEAWAENGVKEATDAQYQACRAFKTR